MGTEEKTESSLHEIHQELGCGLVICYRENTRYLKLVLDDEPKHKKDLIDLVAGLEGDGIRSGAPGVHLQAVGDLRGSSTSTPPHLAWLVPLVAPVAPLQLVEHLRQVEGLQRILRLEICLSCRRPVRTGFG